MSHPQRGGGGGRARQHQARWISRHVLADGRFFPLVLVIGDLRAAVASCASMMVLPSSARESAAPP
jgi:hypothetical protein